MPLRARVSSLGPYAALLFLSGVDAAGYSVIAPLTPAIARQTGAGEAVIGLLVAAFGLSMVLAFYPGGRLVWRFGASPVIAVAGLLSALGALAFVFGETIPVYVGGRLLMGAGSGGLWIAIALAAIERWPGGAFPRLAGIMAAYSVGSIAGPALGILGGIRWPFLAYAVLVALAVLLLPLLGSPHENAPAFGSSRSVLRMPGFLLACSTVMLVSVSLGVLDGNLPLHFSSKLGQAGIAGLYVLGALVAAGCSVGAARFSLRPTILAAVVALVSGVAIAGLGSTVSLFVAGIVVIAVGTGLGQTSAMGVLLDTVGPERLILAMAVWSQVFALAYLIGPSLGGVAAETVGFGAVALIPLAFGVLVLAAWVASRPGRPGGTDARSG